jgi:SnoaL-like protein
VAVPSGDEIRRFFDRYFAAWNDHDKEGFLDAWHSVANDVSAEDPVGTPSRRGWEECVTGPWDLMNAVVTMTPEHLLVCANEAAAVIRIDALVDGQTVTSRSIEVFRFGDDGSVLMRTWWEPQGEMFAEYAQGPPT